MKRFFGDSEAPAVAVLPRVQAPARPAARPVSARIAVYDSLAAAPRVEDLTEPGLDEAIESLSARAYQTAREMGGGVPYTLIREIVENLVHAGFSEAVVSVLDGGNTIRFSDQGPGIPDKERAFLPGFSTATAEMKRFIRGVGSGLPIVRECLGFAGGSVAVEDNLERGTVVTLRVDPPAVEPVPLRAVPERAAVPETGPEPEPLAAALPVPRLTTRHKKVLSLVMELGSVGPTVVSDELNVSLSTAYRDLSSLEEVGLIVSDPSGKRQLTGDGIAALDDLLRT